MTDTDTARGQRLQDLIDTSPFYRYLGVLLEHSAERDVRLRLPYTDANTTQASALHGGAIGSLADAVGALAAWSSGDASPQGFTGRTIACDVSYLAGALGVDVYGRARVLRRGKAIIFSEVRVEDGDGKPLAYANHLYRIDPRTEGSSPSSKRSGERGASTTKTKSEPGTASTPLARTPSTSLPPPNPESLRISRQALAESGSRSPFSDGMALELQDFDHAYVTYRLPCAPPNLDHQGGVAGGALYTAVDHAGAIATWMTSEYHNPRYFGSTLKTQVEIFAPNIRDDLAVAARALAIDGELHYGEVTLSTAAGAPVARGTTVYRIVDRPPEQ